MICHVSYTAPIWTGDTASSSGYTDHTLVLEANSGCDLAQGDGKCGSELGFAEDGKSLGIQVFGGSGSKKIYTHCLLLIETQITNFSGVCKAGDWLSHILFKIHCFPLPLAWFCLYRNALTRHCSNFPSRYNSPSLGPLEDICSKREHSLFPQFCESTKLGYQLLHLSTQIAIYIIVSLSPLSNHFYGDDLTIYIKIAVHKVNCVS